MGDGTAATPETGAGTYWTANGVSDDLLTSAKSYIPEMVWNDTTISIAEWWWLCCGWRRRERVWKSRAWQTGVPGIPADGHRDVPDISLDASPYHDGILYCTQVLTVGSPNTYVSSCQANSFRLSDPGQTDNDNFLRVPAELPLLPRSLPVFSRSLSRSWPPAAAWGTSIQASTNWPRMRLPMRRPFTTSRPGTTRCPARLVPPIARPVPTP